ncbi:MAG: tRNA guanosine(34) transglycosylase Tgt [Candidatus Berkelbacteria bacterium]|nr:tRNA guanosine(34) transglycosylase Tgt [Candidatus Berkelbacteria bacterium]
MKFLVKKQTNKSSLRIGELTTANGKIQTPVFMPVGTVGAVKSVAPWELHDLGAEIILGNTYHLYLRPGEKLIAELGGLSEYNRWQGPVLTDSGGFQAFSLGKRNFQFPISNFQTNSKSEIRNEGKENSLVKITDDGVEFKSYLDGSKHFFTPEKVIDIQLALGSNIIMPLDVCPPASELKFEVEKAAGLSIKWLKRSKKHLDRKFQETRSKSQTNLKSQIINLKPALFGIVQGGIFPDLRKYCAEKMVAMDLDGYAIGGLAVGEKKKEMFKIVALLNDILPVEKPRYLMGVGTPEDIIQATKLGIDMFDCVLPTRMARHNVAYVKLKTPTGSAKARKNEKLITQYREINLLNSKYREDKNSLDENCQCPTCKNQFSTSYLSHLVREKEILGVRLLTLHNLWTYFALMREIRASIDKRLTIREN